MTGPARDDIRRIDLGMVNAYLVRAGDGFVLIDTGMPRHWSRLESELLQTGCLPAALKLVIVTHGDLDHVGNCAELQRRYGAKIAMHRGDVETVRSGRPAKRSAGSAPAAVLLWLARVLPGRWPRFEPDVLLAGGQDLAQFGLPATVIHTPGHTSGSIAIVTRDGRLFCGDLVSNRKRPGRSPFFEDEGELEASLRALQGLDAHTVYPGHGRPFPFAGLAEVE